jgi:beta-glucanase (GH16 family)
MASVPLIEKEMSNFQKFQTYNTWTCHNRKLGLPTIANDQHSFKRVIFHYRFPALRPVAVLWHAAVVWLVAVNRIHTLRPEAKYPQAPSPVIFQGIAIPHATERTDGTHKSVRLCPEHAVDRVSKLLCKMDLCNDGIVFALTFPKKSSWWS